VSKHQLEANETLAVDTVGGIAAFPKGSWVEETVVDVPTSVYAATSAPQPEAAPAAAKPKAAATKTPTKKRTPAKKKK